MFNRVLILTCFVLVGAQEPQINYKHVGNFVDAIEPTFANEPSKDSELTYVTMLQN